MNLASAKIILDTRRVKVDGTYPIKLEIYHDRIRKHYPTKYNLTEDDFTKVYGEKPRKTFKDIRFHLNDIITEANHILSEMKVFTHALFERNRNHITKDGGNVNDFYKAAIKELEENEQIKTASLYTSSLTSLSKFGGQLGFEDITPSFLEKYEKWMLKASNTRSTVGMYLRVLRTMFNRAITENKVSKELYPFGRSKYVIPTGANIKKALSINEIALLFKHKIEPRTAQDRARDYWCFSYLCNGINMADIARLRWRDIRANEIHLERKKTARANRGNTEMIIIPILAEAKVIINKWGNKKGTPENYIFPILDQGMTPVQESKAVEQFIKTINKFNKRLGKELGIEIPLITYAARHSYATIQKRYGVSTASISEALGHRSESTTRKYLASLDTETRMKNALVLTAFQKRKPTAVQK